jgi:hypothetical protein
MCSLWWAEEPPETCTASVKINKFKKRCILFAVIWNYITMHGHMNIKYYCSLCSILPQGQQWCLVLSVALYHQLNSVVLFCLQYCTTSSTLHCCPIWYRRPTTSSTGRCYHICSKYPTVPTSIRDLVSATKPCVGSSWNSLYDLFTKRCRINTRFVTVTVVTVIFYCRA